MSPYTSIPSLTGRQLIKLLVKDGWLTGRKSRHGRTLTLSQILGIKQTGLGKAGLLALLNKYGL